MASYTVRKLDPSTIARAKARAVEQGTTLDTILHDEIQRLADTCSKADAGRLGAQARAEALSPERRSEIARMGALARHGKAHDRS